MLQQKRNSARVLTLLVLLAGLAGEASGCNWGMVLDQGRLLGDTIVELVPLGGNGEAHQLLGKVRRLPKPGSNALLPSRGGAVYHVGCRTIASCCT